MSTDKELIETLCECLGKNNKITINPKGSLSKKTAYRVQIGDIVLYEWLERIGLSPRKSLSIGSLKIPNKYFPDFLRGHIDGDGTILSYEDKYNTHLSSKYVYIRLFVFFLSGSEKHIAWLRKRIEESKSIKGSVSSGLSKSQVGNNPYFKLKFSTKEAKIILNWIYYNKNLPCLKRKFEIAKPFINFEV